MPFRDRASEWELYQPLVGKTMLELGNKRAGNLQVGYRPYKPFFENLGFRHVSVDWNGEDGALKMDLRKPLGLGTFDMVSNIGTTEHVDQQEPVWRNICEAMHVGSVFVSTTPLIGDWTWHGDWYPSEQFYRKLAELNGLSVDRLYIAGEKPRRMIFTRMTRLVDAPFRMPDAKLIHRNIRRPRA